MEIKFLDLSQEYAHLKSEIDCIMDEILQSSSFIGGKYLQEFETNFAHFMQARGCVGVGNGTDALEIAIKALNLEPNSEIILPANSFIASAEAILNNGHQAVFVDCKEDYLIDPLCIQNALTKKTAAIMPVHLYGKACDMETIIQIAQTHHLKIIEDCSQAHGAKAIVCGEEKSIGSIGDVGCFSFYPSKNLGAYGDGGAIISNDLGLLETCFEIANHGIKNHDKYNHHLIGRNSRLDALQAGILNIKLKYLKASNTYRQQLAKIYHENLSIFKNILPPSLEGFEDNSVWHLYVIRMVGSWEGKREAMIRHLKQNNIACGIHYPSDLGSLDIITTHCNCKVISNKNAKKYAKEILSLPIGNHISQKEIQLICQKIQEFETSCNF
ncbi:DegT/DnrJ/EryC1/StrS family aminotransferase [Helicobacter sp. 11S03491-1]|uniref:DegT/DnrJ/EryC1/StrS family aminotransferase n=1 Tax=Helicobacter sp. 11S03491-1 TaxID=1476196 RepID=UPI000BA716F6|nr:DegT/DnrJ/EryC1/StrS family aminotransferase [Helicobacter sp. 11S03491-1]PAF43881.1 hypothetical protein BKH45_01050 [Helicobacter sp. 11S03491-1]